jgi:hypothetical protein
MPLSGWSLETESSGSIIYKILGTAVIIDTFHNIPQFIFAVMARG